MHRLRCPQNVDNLGLARPTTASPLVAAAPTIIVASRRLVTCPTRGSRRHTRGHRMHGHIRPTAWPAPPSWVHPRLATSCRNAPSQSSPNLLGPAPTPMTSSAAQAFHVAASPPVMSPPWQWFPPTEDQPTDISQLQPWEIASPVETMVNLQLVCPSSVLDTRGPNDATDSFLKSRGFSGNSGEDIKGRPTFLLDFMEAGIVTPGNSQG
ncbi:hypothetical protein L6452_43120 [Arctium lappa]|uniref:Uncharacterized protein n=1 Tax=Arctium lappa TaxID=4217 RepID=A0ACB8XKR4_ARCLA|nr:hypothetical protein L6452_43120 [Arctium lappa]